MARRGVFLKFMGEFASDQQKQFLGSTAKHRVTMVLEATTEIVIRNANDDEARSRLRDHYRYSLGPMIDELERGFGENGFNEQGPWPCLFQWDPNRRNLYPPKDEHGTPYDRWDRYNKYVRPVVVDINVLAFIGHSWLLRILNRNCESIDQLVKLDCLCQALERAFSASDAALEKRPLLVSDMKGSTVVIKPAKQTTGEPWTAYEKELSRRLVTEFATLHRAWEDWLHLAKPR